MDNNSRERSAEFDRYADGYDAGMDNPIKRRLATSPDVFIEVKVRWLLRDFSRTALDSGALDVLDYGCGAGTFMKVLRRLGFTGRLRGCDISEEMVNEARKSWTDGPVPDMSWMENQHVAYPGDTFDLIVVCAVLHHVPRPDRMPVYLDLVRVLKPGGRLYVFEHNPYNPVTQWVVRNTAIDQNAVLLSAREVRSGMSQAGLGSIRTENMLFFPPRWQFTRGIENALWWLPLGGQYVVIGTKP